jgi:hypothetical protein
VSWGVLHGAMLLGLLGIAIPVVVHLLHHGRAPTVDWGAMQFLILTQRASRRLWVREWLLLTLRMSLLALVALALARPFLRPGGAAAGPMTAAGLGSGPARRDVVLVLDGSASMSRRERGTTPWAEAITWARQFLGDLGPGSSLGLLVARDRVVPLVDPPSLDLVRIRTALDQVHPSGGSSDLAAALTRAFQSIERTENPLREVIILTDGQRFAWRPAELERWTLLRELHRALPVPPRIWSLSFGIRAASDGPNAAVGPLELKRGLWAARGGLPIPIVTYVANAGPGPATRTAELDVDGSAVPGSVKLVGPIPAGGRAPLRFEAMIPAPGSHALTVRLSPDDDSLPADDKAEAVVEVTEVLPVLFVDGEPSPEPFRGATDFARAALAPAGLDAPQVRASMVPAARFQPDDLKDPRVVILAGIERLSTEQTAALEAFLARGGGVLLVPGRRIDAGWFNQTLFRGGVGWAPAGLGLLKGDFVRKTPVARPAPGSFADPVMSAFGPGLDAPLASAQLFAYRVLEPSTQAPAARVSARLDSGDPWIVERPHGSGNVVMVASTLDADGGTLPVNPDFVPWLNELVFHLASAGTSGSYRLRPGDPISIVLDPAPPLSLASLQVRTPSGNLASASIVRTGSSVIARYDDTTEPGVYRIAQPGPAGGTYSYVVVERDPRESDLALLAPGEAATLSLGWPLAFEASSNVLSARLRAVNPSSQRELWRGLVIAALAILCLEVGLTRRLSQGREQAS